jgi:transposase-like protein/IS1 family transposase
MFAQFKTLPQLLAAFPTEQDAIDHFTAIRWANGKFCPLCGNADEARIGTLTGTNTHKCYACRKRFSIRVGTIFQDTKLGFRTWYAAIWMITAHPKGIASTTLATDLGITQKSAWFVLHRLRHASRTKSFNMPLGGIVEVDETYVGGKAANRHKGKSDGPGTAGKTAVVGALSRDGGFVARVVAKTDTATLDGFVHEVVSKDAHLVMTDEHSAYRHLDRTYDHQTVSHGAGEYVRGIVHTNSIEGAWSELKRQIIGIHHWVSPKHLQRYVNESAYRVNRRDMPKGERVNNLLAQTEGPIPYKVLIA